MPRTTLALTSFVSGELGDKLSGRIDFAKYNSGAKQLTNMLIHPQGAATRRVGTQFISEVKTSAKKTRLIPFEFSTVQAYVLEFGDQYMRVYKDKGQVLSGGSAFEISTPYLEAELFDLKFAQSADVLYIVHPNRGARKLSRTGHTSWTLTEIEFTDGPYLIANDTATTLTPSGTTGNITITASASTFASTDVNRLVRFSNGYAKITGFTSATVVNATVRDDFDNTSSVTDWKLGAFSDTTGHPSTVSFFEQRLVFAGTDTEPQTLFFSKSGDYENMTTGTNADDAMVYTIASNQVNRIRYLKSVRTLIVGTTGGEFTVSADGTNAAVTPTNVTIKKQSSYGTANVDAITAGNATLFLQKAKRKIRELQYNFDSDGYIAPDLTILNDIVTKSGVNEMAYQQEPDSILWCVRDDGIFAGLTYQRSENVVAWHQHKLGGTFGTGTSGQGMPSNPDFRGPGNNKGFRKSDSSETKNTPAKAVAKATAVKSAPVSKPTGRGGRRGGSTGGKGSSSTGGSKGGSKGGSSGGSKGGAKSSGSRGQGGGKASRSKGGTSKGGAKTNTRRSRRRCDIRCKYNIMPLTNMNLIKDDLAEVAYFVKEIQA